MLPLRLQTVPSSHRLWKFMEASKVRRKNKHDSQHKPFFTMHQGSRVSNVKHTLKGSQYVKSVLNYASLGVFNLILGGRAKGLITVHG